MKISEEKKHKLEEIILAIVLVAISVGLVAHFYEIGFWQSITSIEWFLFGIFFMLILIYFKLKDIQHHVFQVQLNTMKEKDMKV